MEKTLKAVKRLHLIQAMEMLDSGVHHKFADSSDYDVRYEGKLYPPKALVGVAAELALGREFVPKDFRGGIGTPCFKVLTDNGLEIVDKSGEGAIGVRQKQQFGEIPGIPEGSWFPDKKALRSASIHRMQM